MKNRIIRLVFATLVFSCSNASKTFAQYNDSKSVQKGLLSVDGYYGFPNLFLSSFVSNMDKSYSYHVKSIGPIGIRGEYFIEDYVAMGLEVNYSTATINWNEENYSNPNPNVKTVIPHDISFTRYRILAKCNFHFGASKHLDWYAGGGIGYNSINYTQHTNGVAETFNPSSNATSLLASLPISFRFNFGGKYYFNENFGAGFEAGISGGPLLLLAVCTKFN